MLELELLSPARNADIGIAAIDCGADAVYIAGPDFGARKAAGNSFEDIARLCRHAHRFGARVFVTFNISVRDNEVEKLHSQMLAAQEAGADAFIVRDERIFGWEDICVPLHASTQCAIRDPERARHFRELGAGRIVLEREMSLREIKAVREAVDCEIECFVHGALCVCYSGDCRLSEYLDGRSADRGECIQACRSLYDLIDKSGKVLVRNKALLSLKDFNLHDRLGSLAGEGVCSFKIEGRLKGIQYVRNVTSYYSMALDKLVAENPLKYRRASFGQVSGGFVPDPDKTFNRGYTELYLDGRRGSWSSMDAPSHLGTFVGTVRRLRRDRNGLELSLAMPGGGRQEALNNGDGFAFVSGGAIVGFRGDICKGDTIRCKAVEGLRKGVKLYRNIDAAFEKTLDRELCKREIPVSLQVKIHDRWAVDIKAGSQDGREVMSRFKAEVEAAENRERAEGMFREQLSKRSGHYLFSLDSLETETQLPLLSASTLNSMRRFVAQDLDSLPCKRLPLMDGRTAKERNTLPLDGLAQDNGQTLTDKRTDGPLLTDGLADGLAQNGAQKDSGADGQRGTEDREAVRTLPEGRDIVQPLMRSRYCIRYELGMCSLHQGAKDPGPLFLLNNGRRLALHFDCKACEMTVEA